MSKIDKSLSDLFGVDPLYPIQKKEDVITEIVPIDPEQRAIDAALDPDATDLEEDAAMIRNNLHGLIRNGNEAFEAIIHIAKAEERISAFEVANNMLANLTSINMQLIDLHAKKKKLKQMGAGDKKTEGAIVNNGGTTNIAFVGTTKELLARMQNPKKEE